MHHIERKRTMAEKIADITVKLLGTLVAFMLTTLFAVNISMLRTTMAKANENTTNIAVMGEQYKYIVKALDDIKEK